MVWLQFYIKIFRVNMAKSVLDNSHWDQISHSLTSIIYQSNVCYSKIYQEEIEKDNSSTLHLDMLTRYFRYRYSIKLSRT